eukprot:9172968-Lingulodinium_polyedra.AAC.1
MGRPAVLPGLPARGHLPCVPAPGLPRAALQPRRGCQRQPWSRRRGFGGCGGFGGLGRADLWRGRSWQSGAPR